MTEAKLADKPILPDPGKYFMLAMRHGPVELAACISPDVIDDDTVLHQIVVALRDNVKRDLALAVRS